MTMIREERPAPGSFDYLLDDPPAPMKPPRPRELMRSKVAAQQKVYTPPPAPPEPPGGNSRVRVEIEICQRSTRRPKSGVTKMLAIAIWTIVAAILLMALVAHGHAEQWRSHRDGFITRFDSDNGDRGTSYQQGFETLTDINRADGSTQHCRSYKQGWQTFTECN